MKEKVSQPGKGERNIIPGIEWERISSKEEVKVMKATNENLVEYIRRLERNVDMHLGPSIKDITNLSETDRQRVTGTRNEGPESS